MVEHKSDSLPTQKALQNLPIILVRVIFIMGAVIITLLVVIALLFPLKEKIPYLVEFKTSQDNYVTVRKANKETRSDKAIIHREIKGYVKARETIDQVDELRRYTKIVRLKSSPRVYETFLNSYQGKKELWEIEGFVRSSKIENVSDVVFSPQENEYITIVEFSITDSYRDGTTTKSHFYKATMRYGFSDQKISQEDLTLNPMGLNVVDYVVSNLDLGAKR